MTISIPFEKANTNLWEKLDWSPSNEQEKQLIELQALLKAWNKRINLTRLLDKEDYWVNQVFDSLWPFKNELKNPKKLRTCIDIGNGCGFPGLALAIALPGTQITLVDAIKKKTIAIKEIVTELELSSRVNVRNERAELTGHIPRFRGEFDLAIARAVAPAPVTAEYLIPLINGSGEAVLYRGKWNKSNDQALKNALIHLKGNIKSIDTQQLPLGRGERTIVRLQKHSLCPEKFPRPIGIPSKKPLGI